CQSDSSGPSLWKRFGGQWEDLPLWDTNPFDPKCLYIFDGQQANHVAPSNISVAEHGTTTTLRRIEYTDKTRYRWWQYNWSNDTYYGYVAVSNILVNCL
ncbi:hypothetical protein, partial [Pusillimonas sp. T2]|uniref:hypothetical protein n=1 Tax=Pusillimonas sp. T2 TaxID=1548123 RepID=UPI001C1FE928